jgi:hypothetical protein
LRVGRGQLALPLALLEDPLRDSPDEELPPSSSSSSSGSSNNNNIIIITNNLRRTKPKLLLSECARLEKRNRGEGGASKGGI